MNHIGLSISQKQDVKMTADLRQAIEILQYSALEIHDFIAREVGDNPYLEYEDNASSETRSSTEAVEEGEGGWDDAWDNWAINDAASAGPASAPSSMSSNPDAPTWESRATKEKTLQEHVQEQFTQIVKDPKLRLIGHFLTDALDESGYLHVNMEEIAAKLKVSVEMVDDARAILQTLEPAGIGATSLAECLRLQMHAKGRLDATAEVLLSNLDKLATRQFAALAKLAGTDEEEIRLTLEDIQTCNPKPGMAFASTTVEAVIPDVVVEKTENGWRAELNGVAFPRLAVGGETPVNRMDAKTKAYIAERQGRAKWLVGALEQRAKNTLTVARYIVKAQEQFFEAGLEFLVPLTLKNVADQVALHESTVSRITSGKYMQTPLGVFEMKHFFSAGLGTSGGNVTVAANSVQAMVARMVKAENPQKPYSDEQLVKLLAAEGVEVARRTVAKYRGILGIPGTSDRRVR